MTLVAVNPPFWKRSVKKSGLWLVALILTALRYANEVVDPLDLEDLKTLIEPTDTELELASKIIDNLTGEFTIDEYHDGFKEKVEQAIEQKIKGETIVAEAPKSEEVKALMEALQETLKRLQQP